MSKWTYIWEGHIYWGERLIFGILIGFHIWGHIFKWGLYTEGILTGFYGIGYGIEFNHFMKIFGNSNGKKHGKIPHKKETETLVHNI